MSERWLPVPGWEGLYEVSDLGRVKSVSRVIRGKDGVAKSISERFIGGSFTDRGYVQVALCRGNVRTTIRLHRLVLMAFVGPCPDGMEGCHFDGVRANNVLSNLRWGTKEENGEDRIRHRSTHCKHGHLFSEENTLTSASGIRNCRPCNRLAKARYRERKAS